MVPGFWLVEVDGVPPGKVHSQSFISLPVWLIDASLYFTTSSGAHPLSAPMGMALGVAYTSTVFILV